ncbi:hypothetical protein EDI_044500 [Entamoeba dispar SAW760]|uniref:Rho-GAP domain-containing protein n=1 Tax=Entamoeba dispar (strain ATCC PRA-260 / SAW760) TaxID=370354 RepID=B0EHV0_ENTDS|nr:uncharacterized protein EDI_044500 [Entamoeba dispar SAW760]EDR25894.1 hypothetical protein EDI_044500 [Entamoeba dispar SAW760]|eukprot:EDR25894.1 hypothetical protein EDI_044500 [Entamoeba dispar SAW760]
MNPTLATPRRTRPKVMDLRFTPREDNQENNQQLVMLKANKQNFLNPPILNQLGELENSIFCLFYLKNANHFVKSKFNLIRMNMLYSKSTPSTPRSLNSPRSPRKKFSSPELQEELLKYMEKYRMIGDNFVWLSGLVSIFQIKFSEYSQKKLIELYHSIFSVNPIITDGVNVLLSYDTINKKPRIIQLTKNFLFIGKEETKEIDHIIYLTNPHLILINETTIGFNNISIEFKHQDVCVKWIDNLTKLQPWYATVPRSTIRKDDHSLIMFNPDITSGNRNRSSNDLMKSHGSLMPLIQKSVSTPNKGLSPRSKGLLSKGFISRLSNKSKTTKIIKIVGVSLETLSVENNIITLPPNISLLIQYLKKHAITIEGIFRVSGSKDNIQKVVEKLDTKMMTFECLTNFDIHSVAGALKLYIKLLPEQVIPKFIDDRLYELWKQKNTLQEDDLFQQFHEIYKDIPPMTYNFLNELLDLLHLIAMNKEITKMNIENCVTCLAPSLRGYPFVYTYSIQHYSQLFPKEIHNQTKEKTIEESNTTM